MTIKIGRSRKAPTRTEILGVETELGVKLPAEFIDCLSINNGGVPENNLFKISENNDSGVNSFIPLDQIIYEAKLVRVQIGENLVPIAYAEGGNYVCIATSEIDRGSIFFMDHEIPGLNAVTKIAASLTKFLEITIPFDPKQFKANPGQVKSAWINPKVLKKNK